MSFCQKQSCATLVHTSGENNYGIQGLASTTGKLLVDSSVSLLGLHRLLQRFLPICTFHNLRWPCPYQITADPLASCSKWYRRAGCVYRTYWVQGAGEPASLNVSADPLRLSSRLSNSLAAADEPRTSMGRSAIKAPHSSRVVCALAQLEAVADTLRDIPDVRIILTDAMAAWKCEVNLRLSLRVDPRVALRRRGFISSTVNPP